MRKILKCFVLYVLFTGLFCLFYVGAGAKELCYEYAYESLSDSEKAVYGMLKDCVSSCSEEFVIDKDTVIYKTEFAKLVELYSADHPGQFWFCGGCNYSVTSDGRVVKARPKYELDGDVISDVKAIEAAKEKFDKKINDIITELENSEAIDAEYEKALWLHDKVIDIVEYDLEAKNDQTAYGALVDGRAVCTGYAKLYQYLLDKAGLPAWTVKGISVNPQNGDVQNHAWTLMWLDGDCVYTDITWDDQGKEKFHLYFANDINNFHIDHAENTSLYAPLIPQSNGESCSHHGYFEITEPESNLEAFNLETVKAVMKESKQGKTWKAVVYDKSGSGFFEWLSNAENRNALIRAVSTYPGRYSFRTFQVGTSARGAEIHVRMERVLEKTEISAGIDKNKKCNVSVSVGQDDVKRNASVLMAFYDSDGKFLGVEFSDIDYINDDYTGSIPEGAATFKAMVLENGSISPLCGAQSININ